MTSVQTLTVANEETEIRLDRWFKRHFPDVNHGLLEKWLRSGNVRVDGKRAKSNQRLEAGQEIRVPPIPAAPAQEARPVVIDERMARELIDSVIYKDDDVLALNKPPGLPVQGGTGMSDKHIDAMLDVLKFERFERPRLVHRLDKDTSGVLVLGRTPTAAAKLAAAFKGRAAQKLYWALVVGVPKISQGLIDAPLAKLPGRAGEKVTVDEDAGKRAVTLYRVVDSALRHAAWLELQPRTGRTHQLRAHCLLLETPILGDGKYGGKDAIIEGSGISRKLHLHARALRLPHPRGGTLELIAELPPHMAASFAFFGFEERQAGEPFEAFEED
ncbi:MAG: RluA family pseudouridine synthase [Magnetospirillum sp.]|nr:RluA family pseudouridine synthase [Magnetospirillum sp.]